MDQDFHYYGTFYSALCSGFDKDDATLIAKASNFIDFFNEEEYDSGWSLVSETKKSPSYSIIGKVDHLRHTFQHNFWTTYRDPQDSVWCAYHFIPGNYDDPAGTPTREEIHGDEIAQYLPKHIKRNTQAGQATVEKYHPKRANDLKFGAMLNRPQSALSRRLVEDAVLCATNDDYLENIISLAVGGETLLTADRADVIHRFKLILLGVRAHVIADTWAHQDHCGLDNIMNTYWDVNYNPDGWNPLLNLERQAISYTDASSSKWKDTVLTSADSEFSAKLRFVAQTVSGLPVALPSNLNFESVPDYSSFLGHAWLGHFPDFSFIKFRYKPRWTAPGNMVERDNPKEYEAAWVELSSLFFQAKTGRKLELDERIKGQIKKARQAIQSPANLSKELGRVHSQHAWLNAFTERPSVEINTAIEPDANTVMTGRLEVSKAKNRGDITYVDIQSDLYLFLIAADYHFHFIKNYLNRHRIYDFTGDWAKQRSVLSDDVVKLFL